MTLPEGTRRRQITCTNNLIGREQELRAAGAVVDQSMEVSTVNQRRHAEMPIRRTGPLIPAEDAQGRKLSMTTREP